MKTLYKYSLLLLLSASCSDSASRLEDVQNMSYYFPLNTFSDVTTYYFVNQNDTVEKSVWKMKSYMTPGDTLLHTSIFDGQNRLLETMVESIEAGNSNINSYVLYYYDQQGNQRSSKCQILDSAIFKSGLKPDEQISWKVSFVDSTTMNVCELTKTRQLKSQEDSLIIFTDVMQFIDLGTQQSYEYTMTSVYQRAKGLVSFKLELPERTTKDFVLKSIR